MRPATTSSSSSGIYLRDFRDAATESDVTKDHGVHRHHHVVRGANRTNNRADSRDAKRRGHRLSRPNTFESRVNTYPVGHVQNFLGGFLPALREDVCRTKFSSKLLASRVPAQRKNALCP